MSALDDLLGPRPHMTLVIEESRVVEIWVDGRAPLIGLHDYDWGETDPDANRDAEGLPLQPDQLERPGMGAWPFTLPARTGGQSHGTTRTENTSP